MAYVNRGEAYDREGQQNLALQDFDKAITIDPDFSDAYYCRGLSYSSEGRNALAIQDFDKALQLNPNYLLAKNARDAARARISH